MKIVNHKVVDIYFMESMSSCCCFFLNQILAVAKKNINLLIAFYNGQRTFRFEFYFFKFEFMKMNFFFFVELIESLLSQLKMNFERSDAIFYPSTFVT